jgi:hypothetical protein
MVEKINRVSNPLTITAIFAALAEVNGTIAIGLVRPELQPIFIWFIIGFPTLLILLFFITLNFNPRVIMRLVILGTKKTSSKLGTKLPIIKKWRLK